MAGPGTPAPSSAGGQEVRAASDCTPSHENPGSNGGWLRAVVIGDEAPRSSRSPRSAPSRRREPRKQAERAPGPLPVADVTAPVTYSPGTSNGHGGRRTNGGGRMVADHKRGLGKRQSPSIREATGPTGGFRAPTAQLLNRLPPERRRGPARRQCRPLRPSLDASFHRRTSFECGGGDVISAPAPAAGTTTPPPPRAPRRAGRGLRSSGRISSFLCSSRPALG